LTSPGPANRDAAKSTDARLPRTEVGLTPSRDALQAVSAPQQGESKQSSDQDQRGESNLPGTQAVKQSLLGLEEKKEYPDYDPAKAQESRVQAIREMVDRFEEVLTRIDDYIQEQTPEGASSSLHARSGEGKSRTLDALVGAADALFENLIEKAKPQPGESKDALNVVL
jgi:hypothetical protein